MTVSYSYALVRVLPHLERGEFINCGVILYCAERKYLGARIHLDRDRLMALQPEADLSAIERHLNEIARICSGDEAAGEIAEMPAAQRFHWLVSPKSAIIRVSEVHSGLCSDPEERLDQLVVRTVLTASSRRAQADSKELRDAAGGGDPLAGQRARTG